MLPPSLPRGVAAARPRAGAVMALSGGAPPPAFAASSPPSSSPSSLLRPLPGLARVPSRSFWGWRRRGCQDWASHLDPMYHRFARTRTLQTRARLLERLKRRGTFDWDVDQRPFFSGRHMRWASHWAGSHGPRWPGLFSENCSKEDFKLGRAWSGHSGSPLLNGFFPEYASRADMQPGESAGYHWSSRRGPNVQDYYPEYCAGHELQDGEVASRRGHNPYDPPGHRYVAENSSKEELQSRKAEAEAATTTAADGPAPDADAGASPRGSPRDTEWKAQMDAMRKRLDQDPYEAVFGRRFEPFWSPLVRGWPKREPSAHHTTEPPPPAASGPPESSPAREDQAASADADAPSYASFSSTSWDSWTNRTKRTEWDSASGQTHRFEYDPVSNRMVEIEEQPTGDEKAVTPPAPNALSSDTATPAPARSDEKAHVPPALQKLPKDDLDLLTANDVRASMGKVREQADPASRSASSPAEKAAMESEFDATPATSESDAEIATLLREHRQGPTKKSPESGAAATASAELEDLKTQKSRLIYDEHGVVDIDGHSQAAAELNQHVTEVEGKLRAMGVSDLGRPSEEITKQPGESMSSTRLPSSLDRRAAAHKAADRSAPLQPSLERMQSKELDELDDAAAHESTEPLTSAANLPRNWSKQADLLQENRVKRSLPTRRSPYPATRWIDDMDARKAAGLAARPEPSRDGTQKLERLRRANRILEAEVQDQQTKLQAHENRYAHKLRGLRQELETAYAQSALHSDKHVERIRFLEAELEKAQRTARQRERPAQPAASVDEANPLKNMQGEGDFCTNVTKFARSGKWYKQPAENPPQPSPAQIEAAARKLNDQALVKDVRQIYEKQYGAINAGHRQPSSPSPATGRAAPPLAPAAKYISDFDLEGNLIDEAEFEHEARDRALAEFEGPRAQHTPRRRFGGDGRADLGKALAEHEQSERYGFHWDNLEAEIAGRERDAHEAQSVAVGQQPLPGPKLVRDDAPKLIPTELDGKPAEATKPAPSDVDSASSVSKGSAPLYKVLAYNSEKDKFTTSTTDFNYTGTERAISASQALSQLYHPERFMPSVTELQKDGFQVIYGTRDLLVLKKANQSAAPTPESQPKEARYSHDRDAKSPALHDHGVITPKENAMAQEAANYYDKYRPAPPSYDPTSIENGQLMPQENATAQDAANAYDRARLAVNPVDGTTALASPGTARYADATSYGEDVEHGLSPRVRREERVFTGAKRRWNESHERHHRRARRDRRAGSRRRGAALKWALSVGAGSATLTYIIGVAAEAARRDRKDRERWQEVLETRRGRWE